MSSIQKSISLILENPTRKDVKESVYINVLKYLGFELTRQNGSHMVFHNNVNNKTIVGVSHNKHMKASYIKELREYIINYREDLCE